MTHEACDEYITELIAHIHNLQDRIDDLEAENRSWRMWNERAIGRLKEMQK